MARYLIRRLERFTRLSDEDKQVLEETMGRHARRLGPREDIIHEGDRPQHVNFILDGWACRYKMLEDGRRQILAYFVPGDLCDLNITVLREMDHSIATVTSGTVAEVSPDALRDITARRPQLAEALLWSTMVTESIQREWAVNLGQRTAYERMGHLLCELFIRLRAVGLTNGKHCELPLTQTELADTLGLSTVHTNRTLQELRSDGLISLQGKALTINDFASLQSVALFNPNYLHFYHDGLGGDRDS